MLIAAMCVYQEEALIGRAIRSLQAGGVNVIHVFDGAWEGFGDGPSSDGTLVVARDLGCTVHEVEHPWANQETKRSAMFHAVGAEEDDHVLVFDADEELEGRFPQRLAAGQHYNLMVKCVGPNDMPGIRGEWPHGDYYADYKPELRVFAYSRELHCKWPGGYWDFAGRIEPYANAAGDPLLPVIDGVSYLHHGNDRSDERKAQKVQFYNVEHPRRKAIQNAEYARTPW